MSEDHIRTVMILSENSACLNIVSHFVLCLSCWLRAASALHLTDSETFQGVSRKRRRWQNSGRTIECQRDENVTNFGSAKCHRFGWIAHWCGLSFSGLRPIQSVRHAVYPS